MVNLFSLGFGVRQRENLHIFAADFAHHFEEIHSPHGTYKVLRDENGAELWFEFNEDGRVIGFNSHFNGTAKMKVALIEHIKRPSDSNLEGALLAYSDPQHHYPESGRYQFVFDAPNFDYLQIEHFPIFTEAQLTAHANSLSAYTSYEEYSKSSDHVFPAVGFTASGMTYSNGSPKSPPDSFAFLSGTVMETKEFLNSFTSKPYIWAKIRSHGGEFDVVADPSVITGEVVQGGILLGNCWLSGKVHLHTENTYGQHDAIKDINL